MLEPEMTPVQRAADDPATALSRLGGRLRRLNASMLFRTWLFTFLFLLASVTSLAMLDYGTSRDQIWTDYEQSRLLQSEALAERIAPHIRGRDTLGAERALADLVAQDGSTIKAMRAFDENLALVVQTVGRSEPGTGFGPVPEEFARKVEEVEQGNHTILRLPLWTPIGDRGPVVGVIEVIHDTGAVEARLATKRTILAIEALAVSALLSLVILLMTRRLVVRPIREAITYMEAVAAERTDLVLPRKGCLEVRAIYDTLDVFRENIRSREAFAERSREAEESAEHAARERREARRREELAANERRKTAEEAATRRLKEQECLLDDLGELMADVSRGVLTERMPTEDVPEGQDRLRRLINEMLARIQAGTDDVIAMMSMLAEGNLSARMTGEHEGAFAHLQESSDRMAAHLQAMLADFSEHATGMLDDTSDLSASATDLSLRTERTAGSLAETTVALDQIVGSVAATAALASDAHRSAEEARAEAADSDRVVRDAVQSMEEIKSVSREISATLGVIDDIAFQTNLLALNAGVEAARAGEAGRGFAVVASEVRALAQRASDAALQIGGLIGRSSEQIERGVQRVARTGQTLGSLGGSIETISRQISEIAEAAERQSNSTSEINRAMSEIDGATQQNTAMFEEVTTANLSLKNAASRMLKAIEEFDIAGIEQERRAG